jgi:hypothetical protein
VLADAGKHGAGQKYLIQHSAGSGKSNSITWLARPVSDCTSSAKYMLGLVYLTRNEPQTAYSMFNETIELELSNPGFEIGAIFFPELSNGTVSFVEKIQPEGETRFTKRAAALQALEVASKLMAMHSGYSCTMPGSSLEQGASSTPKATDEAGRN